MNAIDLLFHGALIGVALFSIGPFWRGRNENPAGWVGVGLFAAVAALAGLRVAVALDVRPVWIGLLALAAVSGAFWFWLLTRTLFEDGFKQQPWHWSMLATLTVLALARLTFETSVSTIALRGLAAGLVLHALWVVVRGLRDDLVEARLKARMHVVAIAAVAALLTLARPLLANAAPLLVEALARATPLINIALIVAAGRSLFRVERELWPPRPPRAVGAPADPDAADLERLDALMNDEEIWREPGLSVAALASRARLPEYRMRRLILERRGARNFNAYLAKFRLAEAAARLSSDARTPITTIAYDCGFASLGPFNRAFREKFGVTPTLYRKGERAADAPNS